MQTSLKRPETVKRHRISQACSQCRVRKVRCDLPTRQPCSNCTVGSRTCTAPVQPRQWRPSNHSDFNSESESGRTNLSQHGLAAFASALPAHGTQAQSRLVPPGSGMSRGSDVALRPPVQANADMVRADMAGSESTETTPQSVRAGDDEVWARMMQTMTSKDAAGTAQDQTRLATCLTTRPDSEPLRKRVKFGGEPFAHSMLPHMDGHAELSPSTAFRRSSEPGRRLVRGNIAPKAVHPIGKAPWLHANCKAHLDLLAHLAPEDQFYLYEMKKVFYFPQRSVIDALVKVFFESVYPLMPIIDRSTVLCFCEDMYRHAPSSPLLLHSILFTSCQYADLSIVLEAGFQSLADAKCYFYQCAKVLYCHDCEPDSLLTVQALALLGFWWADYCEEKDMRFWVGCAVNMALGMGMHKPVPESMNMPRSQNVVWRRLFWSLYAREHTIAVALGLPFLLRAADCDLQPLSEADFDENDEEPPRGVSRPHVPTCLFSRQSQNQIYSAIKQVELTMQVEKLLVLLNDAREPQEALDTLNKMKSILSRESFFSTKMEEEGFSLEDESTWTKHNIFPVFVLLYHERAVTLYHRRHERALVERRRRGNESFGHQASVYPPEDADEPSVEIGVALREDRVSIFQSAERIIQMLEKLLSCDLLRYAPPHVNTSNFHAMLSLSEHIVSLPKETPEHTHQTQKFRIGLGAMEEMRKCWTMASWAHEMFKKLAEEDFKALRLTAEKHKRDWASSHLNSRLPSHLGSPAPDGEFGALPLSLDLFAPDWYGDPSVFDQWDAPYSW